MITNKAHDFGAMVLAEGIERREEFHFAEISGSSSRRVFVWEASRTPSA